MSTLPECCRHMLEWEAKQAERCAHEWRRWDGEKASGVALADAQSQRIGQARERFGCLTVQAGGCCARLNPVDVRLTVSRQAG